MIETSAVYYHPALKHYVQVTEQQANWVEFIQQDQDTLRWLERAVFEGAYHYYNQGDPVKHDLATLRLAAKEKGLLVPTEFS